MNASFLRVPQRCRPLIHTTPRLFLRFKQPTIFCRPISLPAAPVDLRLRCTEFDQTGHIKRSSGEILKSEFCQHHSLMPRDLRTIDTRSCNQKPSLLVRPEAILINMGYMRALLKSDMVVVFDSFGTTDSYNQSMFMHDLQERLRSQNDQLPYEFKALEAIFIAVTTSLQSELEALEIPVNRLLSDLEGLVDLEEGVNRDRLRDLLQLSKKLSKFEYDVISVRDAIEDVLEHDEDLAAMYLTAKKSGNPREADDHEEVELLLESYLKQTEEIVNVATRLISNLRSTEDVVQLHLDLSRNALMWFDIRLTMITLSTSIIGAYGALFGMNLRNYFEDDPFAFGLVSGAALLTGAAAFLGSLRRLRVLARIRS
ncbi:Mg2+ transporter protein [Hesseltinella vesiculosa]|uniref:Magnesium transporter n=1 Tax=Hesseltinella vesiculosa TaxID=101127 RepID=A0A1X2GU42_9FUNG|nr:Mg2+ transporter protein [Hesseltinella vesiculosa]